MLAVLVGAAPVTGGPTSTAGHSRSATRTVRRLFGGAAPMGGTTVAGAVNGDPAGRRVTSRRPPRTATRGSPVAYARGSRAATSEVRRRARSRVPCAGDAG